MQSSSAENSELDPVESIAVALTAVTFAGSAKVTLKAASPELFVVTFAWPRKIWPSPNPEPSAAWLAKNSRVKGLRRRAVEAAVNCQVAVKAKGRAQNREILQSVDASVRIAGVVSGHAIIPEIDAQLSVVVNGISRDSTGCVFPVSAIPSARLKAIVFAVSRFGPETAPMVPENRSSGCHSARSPTASFRRSRFR